MPCSSSRAPGRRSTFEDAAYVAAGADVVGDEVWNTDVILKINAPSPTEVDRLRERPDGRQPAVPGAAP